MQAIAFEDTFSLFSFQGTSDEVGAFSGEGPPVPIPNTEVKLTSAENTCLATDWEDRAAPTYEGLPDVTGSPSHRNTNFGESENQKSFEKSS